MAKIMTKEGAKLHLVTTNGEPLCRPLVKARVFNWDGYNTSKSMRLTAWMEDDNHCKNCEQMFRYWAFSQFERQITLFFDLEMIKEFPVTFSSDGSTWEYSNTPLWPKAKITHR